MTFAEELLDLLQDIDIQLTDSTPDDLPAIKMAVSARLDVLGNELANAVGHSSAGGCAISVSIIRGHLLGDYLGILNLAPGIPVDKTGGMSADLRRLLIYAVPFSFQLAFIGTVGTETTCEIRLVANDHPDAERLTQCIIEHANLLERVLKTSIKVFVRTNREVKDLRKFCWAREMRDFEVVAVIIASTNKAVFGGYLAAMIEIISTAAGDLLLA
jgi:hypothetical protein